MSSAKAEEDKAANVKELASKLGAQIGLAQAASDPSEGSPVKSASTKISDLFGFLYESLPNDIAKYMKKVAKKERKHYPKMLPSFEKFVADWEAKYETPLSNNNETSLSIIRYLHKNSRACLYKCDPARFAWMQKMVFKCESDTCDRCTSYRNLVNMRRYRRQTVGHPVMHDLDICFASHSVFAGELNVAFRSAVSNVVNAFLVYAPQLSYSATIVRVLAFLGVSGAVELDLLTTDHKSFEALLFCALARLLDAPYMLNNFLKDSANFVDTLLQQTKDISSRSKLKLHIVWTDALEEMCRNLLKNMFLDDIPMYLSYYIWNIYYIVGVSAFPVALASLLSVYMKMKHSESTAGMSIKRCAIVLSSMLEIYMAMDKANALLAIDVNAETVASKRDVRGDDLVNNLKESIARRSTRTSDIIEDSNTTEAVTSSLIDPTPSTADVFESNNIETETTGDTIGISNTEGQSEPEKGSISETNGNLPSDIIVSDNIENEKVGNTTRISNTEDQSEPAKDSASEPSGDSPNELECGRGANGAPNMVAIEDANIPKSVEGGICGNTLVAQNELVQVQRIESNIPVSNEGDTKTILPDTETIPSITCDDLSTNDVSNELNPSLNIINESSVEISKPVNPGDAEFFHKTIDESEINFHNEQNDHKQNIPEPSKEADKVVDDKIHTDNLDPHTSVLETDKEKEQTVSAEAYDEDALGTERECDVTEKPTIPNQGTMEHTVGELDSNLPHVPTDEPSDPLP